MRYGLGRRSVSRFSPLGFMTLARRRLSRPIWAPARHVKVVRFKSITLRWPVPFATAVPGNVDIADILPEPDQELYIQGKKVGTTNITLFDQNRGLVGIIDLDVTLDEANISKQDTCRGPEFAASESPPSAAKSC